MIDKVQNVPSFEKSKSKFELSFYFKQNYELNRPQRRQQECKSEQVHTPRRGRLARKLGALKSLSRWTFKFNRILQDLNTAKNPSGPGLAI